MFSFDTDQPTDVLFHCRQPWSFTATELKSPLSRATSKVWFSVIRRRGSIADSAIGLLYHLLYTPMAWSDSVNGYIYQFVAFVLQAAQTHNITIDGGAKYNVPSGKITIDEIEIPSPLNDTSYTTAAVIGADDFNDENTTVKDLFDLIVNTTRQVTPTRAFPSSLLY